MAKKTKKKHPQYDLQITIEILAAKTTLVKIAQNNIALWAEKFKISIVFKEQHNEQESNNLLTKVKNYLSIPNERPKSIGIPDIFVECKKLDKATEICDEEYIKVLEEETKRQIAEKYQEQLTQVFEGKEIKIPDLIGPNNSNAFDKLMLWWAERRLKSKQWRSREKMIQKLGKSKNKRYIPLLLPNMKDCYYEIRQTTLKAIKQISPDWDITQEDDLQGVIYDIETLEYFKNKEASQVKYSPDGKFLACIAEYTIIIFDLENKCKHTLYGDHGFLSIDFSPDSRLLASAENNQIKLWKITTKECLKTLTVDHEPSSEVTIYFSDNGNKLIYLARKRKLGIFDIKTEIFSDIPIENYCHTVHGGIVFILSSAFCPGSNAIAIAYVYKDSQDNTVSAVWVYNLTTEKCLCTLKAENSHMFILGMAFNDQGTQLATLQKYSGRGEIIIWDITENVEDKNRCLKVFKRYSLCGEFCNNRYLLASGGYFGDVKMQIWDLENEECTDSLDYLYGACANYDGSQIAFFDWDKKGTILFTARVNLPTANP